MVRGLGSDEAEVGLRRELDPRREKWQNGYGPRCDGFKACRELVAALKAEVMTR
jgi:hypothetical protein